MFGLGQLGRLGNATPLLDGGIPNPASSAFFANTGCTYPWYMGVTPNAFYASATDVTWMALEGWDGANRTVDVVTQNHSTDEWTFNRAIQSLTLVDDDHGVPAMCRDHEGYIHIFYGAHTSVMQHLVTAYPDDPSVWRRQPTIGATVATAHPTLVGSVLYLFVRRYDNPDYTYILYKTASLSGGIATWNAPVTIVDFGADSRSYSGRHIQRTDKIHFIFTRSNRNNDYRKDVYYLVYDTTTGDVENVDASVITDVLALPILLATMDASYRIFEHSAPNASNIPALCFDAANAPHVIFSDGPIGGTSWDVKHIRYSGGAWSSSHTLGVGFSRSSGYAVVPKLGGGVTAYWTEAAGFPEGGNMWTADRSSGGAWGSASLLQTAGAYEINEPNAVRDGHADARVVWCETWDTVATEIGTLKAWCYGDSGYRHGTGVYTAPTVILDAASKHFWIVLTSDNLSAQMYKPTAPEYAGARATVGVGAGEKKYFEFGVFAFTDGGEFAVGIANSVFTWGNFLGSSPDGGTTSNSFGHLPEGSNYRGGSNQGATGAYAAGANVGVAVDRTNNKIWFRNSGGDWNNDVIGNQNPATNTGGFAISAIAGVLYPCIVARDFNDQATGKFASTAWTYAAPSGFSDLTP